MRKIIEYEGFRWIDIQNPVKEDVEYLREHFSFHPLVLQEIIPIVWRTKVEAFPTHLFLVLHYPAYSKEHKETRPQELDIVITKNAIVTSHYRSIVPLRSLFDKCNMYEEARSKYMSRGAGFFLFFLLNEFWENILVKATRINHKIESVDDNIFDGKEMTMLKEISFIKLDIIDSLKIILPQGQTLESLHNRAAEFFGPELEPYLSHLISHWTQAKNELETYKETIRALEETNNSLLANKTNEIVKRLMLFSVIVFPWTLLAAVFGMNTKYLPIVGLPGDFWIITGIMLLGVAGMIGYFKHKKWI